MGSSRKAADHLAAPERAAVAAPAGNPSPRTSMRSAGRPAAPLPPGLVDQEPDRPEPAARPNAVAPRPDAAAQPVHPRLNRGRRSSTAAISIFMAMDARANKHRCGPVYSAWVYAFSPTGRFRTLWDTVILVLVITSCFRDPYQTAFKLEMELWENPGSSGMSYLDIVVDVIFYVDIVLNFWTGYDTGYMIVTNKAMIAKHYLASRFPIDLLATVEWDLLIRFIMCNMECTGDRRGLNDITAIAKMLKVLRLARAGPLISRLTAQLTAHSAYIDAMKFFLYVVVVAHVLACLFFMVPILFECPKLTESPLEDGPELFNTNHTCMATSWRVNYGLNDVNNNVDEHGHMFEGSMGPVSQYTSALYWSLTTMTTIGYGDRGPGNDPEIAFTMVSELIGLFFFVLLLDQITTVHNEVRREVSNKNAIKDEIVQFMKSAIPDGDGDREAAEQAKRSLIGKVVTFVNFKANSKSSHRLDTSGAFSHLSDALQEEISVAVFKPMLATLRLFGHSHADFEDSKNVQRLFEDADPDGSGELDESEVRKLISDLGVILSDADLQEAMDAMDVSRAKGHHALETAEGDKTAEADTQGDVHVELEEFEQWWYQQKHQRPKVSPCPPEMLTWFSLRIQSECSSPGDRIVRRGEYGHRFYIVIQGAVDVRDYCVAPEQQRNRLKSSSIAVVAAKRVQAPFLRTRKRTQIETNKKPQAPKSYKLLQTIGGKESDPVFGLLGVLNDAPCAEEYRALKQVTRNVALYAGSRQHDYTECLYFTQRDLIEGLTRKYDGRGWHIHSDFDSVLPFWQECARNYYHRLYDNSKDPYYWGKYLVEDFGLMTPAEGADEVELPLVPHPQPPAKSLDAAGGDDAKSPLQRPTAEVQLVEQRLLALEANMETRLGRMEEMLSTLVAKQAT